MLEYSRLGFAPRVLTFGTTFYGLTGLHGAHVFIGLVLLAIATLRAFRGRFARAPRRRDPGNLLALRRRNVDRRVYDRLHPLAAVLNPLRSEAEAFRFLLLAVAAFGIIVAAAVLLGGTAGWIAAGVIALLCVGAYMRARSGDRPEPVHATAGYGGRAAHPRRCQ